MQPEQHEAPYERLDVYRKAYQVALRIHRVTLEFPQIEQFELASQLRRSSKSIAINIVEGMGRQSTPREVERYIRVAMGSCDESRIWLNFAKDLEYMSTPVHTDFTQQLVEIGRMLRGIINRYQSGKTDARREK
jgi:four helix bundle protein